jgi:hypothetical protein
MRLEAAKALHEIAFGKPAKIILHVRFELHSTLW